MRRVPESEVTSDFERQYAWGDDERSFYHPKKKKASVFGGHLRLRTVLELFHRWVPAGSRVADLACAQGNFALGLAEAGYDVTAVDLKQEFLEYARKKHTHGKLSTQQGNLIDFRSPTLFDGVLMGEVIEHVAHPDQLLQSANANLKPGGILILTTPNGGQFGSTLPTFSQVTDFSAFEAKQFHWGDHLFLYTRDELRRLLEAAGFEALEIFGIHSDYVSQIKGIRYLMPYSLLLWLERKTRLFKIRGQESTNTLIAVARKK